MKQNRTIAITSCAFILLNCNSSQIDNKNTVQENQLHEYDTVLKKDLKDSTTTFSLNLDTALCEQVYLQNSSLPAEIKNNFNLRKEDTTRLYPYLTVYNKDFTQMLILDFFYGDAINQYSIMNVSYSNPKIKSKQSPLNLNIDAWKTNLGNELGMAESDFFNKMNDQNLDSLKHNDSTTYTITFDTNHPYVNRYSAYQYEAKYIFVEGNLMSFKFGFVYP